jgi:signal transduction histidine kinase
MEKAIQDADSLVSTFNTILQIAQADAGALHAPMRAVDIGSLAQRLGELYKPLAEQEGLRLIVDAAASTTITGNRDLLTQAIGNLVDNAIKYTVPGGRIILSVESHGKTVTLAVSDSGPGIPAPERKRVLERFTRLDSARSAPGNGLGLSLVNAVARLHRASLHLLDNNPGLRVELRFRSPA